MKMAIPTNVDLPLLPSQLRRKSDSLVVRHWPIRPHPRLSPAAEASDKSVTRIRGGTRCAENAVPHAGRGDRTRTYDPRFWRPMLYQLSYTPKGRHAAAEICAPKPMKGSVQAGPDFVEGPPATTGPGTPVWERPSASSLTRICVPGPTRRGWSSGTVTPNRTRPARRPATAEPSRPRAAARVQTSGRAVRPRQPGERGGARPGGRRTRRAARPR